MTISDVASCLMIGLMSGSSFDGIDAVVVAFDDDKGIPRLQGAFFQAYPVELRCALLALNSQQDNELHLSQMMAVQLAQYHAQAVAQLLLQVGLQAQQIRALGVHGVTIRHRPECGYSIQIINAALLAELTGIDVIGDFRSRDIAAGGQGAPLTPAFHQAIFADSVQTRAVLNLGGISNITYLKPNATTLGFDCGPANVFLDAWCMQHTGAAFDRGGQWAEQGRVIPNLLQQMRADPYFKTQPPKSTGRDLFSVEWLQQFDLAQYDAVDVQATLLQLTARTIAQAVVDYLEIPQVLYVCGGGAHNTALLRQLARLLPKTTVLTTQALGVDPDYVEAIAFAWLAYCFIKKQPANLPAVTGAQGLRILGAYYPA